MNNFKYTYLLINNIQRNTIRVSIRYALRSELRKHQLRPFQVSLYFLRMLKNLKAQKELIVNCRLSFLKQK